MMQWGEHFKRITQWVLPRVCLICNYPTGESVCPECWRKMQLTAQTIKVRGLIRELRYYAPYNAIFQPLLAAAKFDGYIDILDRLATKLARNSQPNTSIDLYVPIPIHPKRLRERGFNQVHALFERRHQEWGMPLHDILQRKRNTTRLFTQNKTQRKRIMEGQFTLKPGTQVKGKRIRLLDDMYTSGTTMNAAAKVLIQAGAASVSGEALCYSSLYDKKYNP